MGKYRLAKILPSESATTAATKTIDLDLVDPISRISIIYKATNGGNSPTAHPAKCVPKIELVDGSNVLSSMSGIEAQALDFYHNKQPAVPLLEYETGVDMEMLFNLNFGRFLYDPQLALDPKKFRMPQLKITHDKSLGACSASAATLQVWANCFDEKAISPIGFLMAKEHYSWTLVSNQYETIELPTDHPHRLLMVQSLVSGQSPEALFDEIKIATDEDKKVLFDGITNELIKLHVLPFGPLIEGMCGIVGTGDTPFYITPTYEPHVVTSSWGGSRDYFKGYAPWGGKVEISAGAASTYFQSLFWGYCPHGAVGLPFGDLQDPDDWLDVSTIKKLKLRVHGLSGVPGSSVCYITIQQLRKY